MQASEQDDALLIDGPQVQGTRCFLALAPLAPAEGDLFPLAYSMLMSTFSEIGFSDIREEGSWNEITDGERGLTGSGHEYIYFGGELRTPEDPHPFVFGYILMVRLGNQVAPVIGYEALGNRCLGLHNPGTKSGGLNWAYFFHSLDFPDVEPRDDEALGKRLLGKWKINGGSSFISHLYAANGRYDQAATMQSARAISSSELLVTTTTFVGAGSYLVQGNQLGLNPDSGRGGRTVHFRIHDEPNSFSEGGSLRVLRVLDAGIEGEPYELSLVVDRE